MIFTSNQIIIILQIKKLIKNASKSLPLAAIVETLTRNQNISVDIVSDELLDIFTNLVTELKANNEANKLLLEELETVNNEIDRLESVDLQFRTKKCDSCDEEIRDYYQTGKTGKFEKYSG